MLSAFGNILFPKRNYNHFAKETYLKNTVAFRCISLIAQSVAAVNYNVVNRTTKEEVENHPFNDVLERADPENSFEWFTIQAIAYLLIAGNSYIERVAPETGPRKGIPMEMYSLRPDRMKISLDQDTGKKKGYVHRVGNSETRFDIDPITGKSDILHLKLFNPDDDHYGAAITETAATDIDINNESLKWNYGLISNQARPGMVFMSKNGLTQQQFDRLQKQLKEDYSGAANAGKSLIMEGMDSISEYSKSLKDMEWTESNRETARRIAMAWGVPPQLIGIPGESTYRNYETARLAFWEDTVMFYVKYYCKELSNFIFFEDLKFKLGFDIKHLPVYKDMLMKKIEIADKASFLTINEKRELAGFGEIDGGDVLLVPTTMIPIGDDYGFGDGKDSVKALTKLGFSKDEAEIMLTGEAA